MRDICRWCFTDREDIIRRGSFGACGVAGRWYALFRYTEVSLIKHVVLYWFPDSIHIQPGGPLLAPFGARGESNSKGPMASRIGLRTGRGIYDNDEDVVGDQSWEERTTLFLLLLDQGWKVSEATS